MSWSKADIARLKQLARDKSLFATEIAERLGRSPQTTRYMMKRLGMSPWERSCKHGRTGGWNAVHAHLAKPAMLYFLTHSFEETMKRMKLTRSEMKSLQTSAYRNPALSHLRKDKRRHDVWSFDETIFLLRHAGLQQRQWIASKLRRGTTEAVREMVSRLGSNTRYINGFPKRLAEELVGHECQGFKVRAGPTGPGVDCRPIIVPWVILYSEAKRSANVPPHFLDALRALSRFQKRIHGTRGINDTVQAIIRAIRRR